MERHTEGWAGIQLKIQEKDSREQRLCFCRGRGFITGFLFLRDGGGAPRVSGARERVEAKGTGYNREAEK